MCIWYKRRMVFSVLYIIRGNLKCSLKNKHILSTRSQACMQLRARGQHISPRDSAMGRVSLLVPRLVADERRRHNLYTVGDGHLTSNVLLVNTWRSNSRAIARHRNLLSRCLRGLKESQGTLSKLNSVHCSMSQRKQAYNGEHST
jgi:hypothetical protein